MESSQLILVEEFCTHYNIEFSFIHSLTEFGLVEIITIEEKQYVPKERINDLEKMIRLHYELNINMEGIDVISHLLQRMNEMNDELATIKNRLRFYENK